MRPDRPTERTPDPKPEDVPVPLDPNEEPDEHGTERINEEAEQEAREEAGVPEGRLHQRPAVPVDPGALPKGREEERRGHSLPNPDSKKDDPVTGPPIGRDEEELHGVHDI